MAPETLTCAVNITPDQLSALRDSALPMAKAQRLREHISGCPACQARLADDDALAMALRQQRELEPGERIVEGVRARLALAPQTPQRRLGRLPRPSRRLWAGLATLAPVAAIILLFIYVFGGLAGHNRPAASKTPTIQPAPTITPLGGKQLSPTATPALASLPPFTPAISAQAAWGTLTPIESFTTPPTAGTQFTVGALSSDATTLVGTSMPAPTASASGPPRVDLISYDFANHTWKPLGPHWNGYIGPWGGAIAVSARYIVYDFNSQPGATCGVCNGTLWTYDLQAGASWEISPGKYAGVQYSGAQSIMASGDYVVFTSVMQQVWMADFATHQVRLALPVGAQPASETASNPPSADGVRLDGFAWPNLIYEDTPTSSNPNTPVATTLRITNLQSNTTTIIPEPINALFQTSGENLESAYLSGDTLYYTSGAGLNGVTAQGAPVDTTYNTLYRIRHVFSRSSSGQPEMLARWQPPQQSYVSGQGINARLILLDGGYAWDIAEGRLVFLDLPAASTPSGASVIGPGMSLSGNYLLVTSGGAPIGSDTSSTSVAGAVYDTTTLPIH